MNLTRCFLGKFGLKSMLAANDCTLARGACGGIEITQVTPWIQPMRLQGCFRQGS